MVQRNADAGRGRGGVGMRVAVANMSCTVVHTPLFSREQSARRHESIKGVVSGGEEDAVATLLHSTVV